MPAKVIPVKLFLGLIIARDIDLSQVERHLALEFSAIDDRSAILPFTHTPYYNNEMGEDLQRQWFSTEFLVHPIEIVGIKQHCIRLEKFYAREDGSRRINIDPGYLDLARIVLPTTKDRAHRIYLRDEIWGEATMEWHAKDKTFAPHPWTFEDYQWPEAKEFFARMREIYKTEIAKIQ